MKERFKEVIAENQTLNFKSGFLREQTIPLNTKLIISLIGARRSGKTYLLYQLINQLLDSGVERKNILFINFEDERLRAETDELDFILQAFNELYPDLEWENTHLFFDEIQNVTGWEKFIRRVYDTKTRNIYITGSNAKLLSSEIATALRGRSLSYTVFPLSFREYLNALNVEKATKTQQQRSKLIHYAGEFMYNGGFAETIVLEKPTRIKLLQEYFNVMMFRDVVERYNVRAIDVLRFFIKKIFASVTVPFSINKTFRDLKSMGYKISNNYLYEFYDHCNAVFLTQSIDKFDFSEIKQAKSEKKTYVIDTGLLSAIEFSVSKNNGKLFENMVFLELLKQGNKLFYFKTKYECDFILEKEGTFYPIQVAYQLEDSDTKKRELRGLVEACRFLKVTEGTIITFDQEETVQLDEIKVNVVAFYKYFL